MSYINKRGVDSSRRKMIARQQVSDVLSYGHIITTKSRARFAQSCLEKIITLSKSDTLFNKRRVSSVVLKTSKYSKEELVKKLFTEIAGRYKNRLGGYSRRLKVKNGDRVILSLV